MANFFERSVNYLGEYVENSFRYKILDVSIGLAYSSMILTNGAKKVVGVSYTRLPPQHTHSATGKWVGCISKWTIREVMNLFCSEDPLERTLGLLAINAVSQLTISERLSIYPDRNMTDLLNIGPSTVVGMVGFIKPLSDRLVKKGATVVVVDNAFQPSVGHERVFWVERINELKNAHHLLITGTSLLFDDVEEVFSLQPLQGGKKILVGPTAQALPELIFEWGFDAVASSFVVDIQTITEVVRHAGGYQHMKPFVQKYLAVDD